MFEVLALLEQLESTYATWMEAEAFDGQKKNDGGGGVDDRRTWCWDFKRCFDDVRVEKGEGSEVYHVAWGRYSADCRAIAACCWHRCKENISSESCC